VLDYVCIDVDGFWRVGVELCAVSAECVHIPKSLFVIYTSFFTSVFLVVTLVSVVWGCRER
jgi:hypothetical protein